MSSRDSNYYRAFRSDGKCQCGLLNPHLTDVEKVEKVNGHAVKYWSPLMNEPPIFFRSTEHVLCFSKEIGGAVIGSVTGEHGFSGGHFCICMTTDKPDVDISDEEVGDFPVLEEVRFHKPVHTVLVGEFTVDKKLLQKIERAYGHEQEWEGFVDTLTLTRLRNKITKTVKENMKNVI